MELIISTKFTREQMKLLTLITLLLCLYATSASNLQIVAADSEKELQRGETDSFIAEVDRLMALSREESGESRVGLMGVL